MTCQAMSGSGFKIGTMQAIIKIAPKITRVPRRAAAGCYMAVAGTAGRFSCGVLIATATRHRAGASISASASQQKSNH